MIETELPCVMANEVLLTFAGTQHPEQSIKPDDPKIIGDLKQRAKINIKHIMHRYASYVFSVQESLEEKGITASQLYRYLKSLPAFCNDDDRQKPVLLSESTELRKATTLDDTFNILGDKYTSFLDYDIFENLLENFGSNDKIENLDYVEGQTLKILTH